MARRGPGRPKKSTVQVDFTNTEDARVLVDPGEYVCVVDSISVEKGSQADYFAWKFKIEEGEYEGQTVYLNTSLSPNALWNLRKLLQCLGLEVPKDAIEIDLEELKGLPVGLVIDHEEYQNRPQARVTDYYTVEEAEEEAEAEEEVKEEPKKGKEKKGKKKGPEPMDPEDLTSMDQEELEGVIEDYDLDVDLSEYKSLRKMRSAVHDALEEADMLEEED